MELPHEQINCKGIGEKYATLFEVAEKAWATALQIAKEGDVIGRGNSEAVNLCVAAVLAKQMRAYYVVVLLCRKGLGNESEQVLRSMFQTFYNLKAMEIVKEKAEFARLWILWDIANSGRQADLLTKTRPELGAAFKELQEKLQEDKRKMGDGAWKNFVKNGPTQLDLASLADHLDRNISGGRFRESYDAFYPQASGSSHGYDLADFALPLEDGHIQVNLSPSEKHLDAIIPTVISLLRDSLAVINFLLGLKKDAELTSLTDLVKSITPSEVAGGRKA